MSWMSPNRASWKCPSASSTKARGQLAEVLVPDSVETGARHLNGVTLPCWPRSFLVGARPSSPNCGGRSPAQGLLPVLFDWSHRVRNVVSLLTNFDDVSGGLLS